MAQYGMGMLYTKTDDGKELRQVSTDLRRRIKEKYYDKHHALFTEAVEQTLLEHGEVLILDCHSYRDIPFHRDLIKKQPGRILISEQTLIILLIHYDNFRWISLDQKVILFWIMILMLEL
jgi:hypothetical protein